MGKLNDIMKNGQKKKKRNGSLPVVPDDFALGDSTQRLEHGPKRSSQNFTKNN